MNIPEPPLHPLQLWARLGIVSSRNFSYYCCFYTIEMHWCMWWKKLYFFRHSQRRILNVLMGWLGDGVGGNARFKWCWFDECLIVVYWNEKVRFFFYVQLKKTHGKKLTKCPFTPVTQFIFITNCWEFCLRAFDVRKCGKNSQGSRPAKGEKKVSPSKAPYEKKTNKFITEQAILNVEKFMDDGSMCDDGVEA